MGRSLNLSQAGEYAIAAIARLALFSPQAVTVERLASIQCIPQAFLAKILGRCAKAGILRSKTGPSGGMTLARDAAKITILEIIEACEGSYARQLCVFYPERSCEGTSCRIYCPLRQEEEVLRNRLGRATLADMAAALKIHPDAQGAH